MFSNIREKKIRRKEGIMRWLQPLVQGNYCRKELCFKSRTDGNSEGNSVIGNKVKEAVNIKTT